MEAELWLTRFIFQKVLAFVYCIAFLIIIKQFIPLLGEKGLLPVPRFVKTIRFWDSPSIFYFFPKDKAFLFFGWLGFILSLLALSGISEQCNPFVSMAVWFSLWIIYVSFINVGQTFYAFGWESMLCETGFLAIFLGSANTAVPVVIIFLLRWVLFRDMFGAGLIKLRGDRCWWDLSALFYHYETQPMPNPLSWYHHWLPKPLLKTGVLFNHFVEVIVPFFFFAPQPLAMIAGVITILFQSMLMVSGNFSFLNLLTIVLAISTFYDPFLQKLIPLMPPETITTPLYFSVAVWGVTVLILVLSIKPLLNLISPRQIMNTSFDPLQLVNTYGAFGTITRVRNEIIIEGTHDAVITPQTKWKEYEFKGKPGDVKRIPPQIAPYHLRLDWLMWFAAMDYAFLHPWFPVLMQKLLQGDKATLSLLKSNPFQKQQPQFVRALLYRYHFTTPQEKKKTGDWWKRELAGTYFPAISLHATKPEQNFPPLLRT